MIPAMHATCSPVVDEGDLLGPVEPRRCLVEIEAPRDVRGRLVARVEMSFLKENGKKKQWLA